MSQRTRLKKMSLGAALILGTVSVSNFAEADENTSNSLEGLSGAVLPQPTDELQTLSGDDLVAQSGLVKDVQTQDSQGSVTPSAEDKAKLAKVASDAAAVANQKVLGKQAASDAAAVAKAKGLGTESGTNKVSVTSGVDEKGNKTPDASTTDAPPVSTDSPETVGDNSSVKSAGSSAQLNKPVRTPGNPFKYDSTRTFGEWIEDLASYFKIKLNPPKKMSNSTRTYKEWSSDFVKVIKGNLGTKLGSEVSKELKKENPNESAIVEEEIKNSELSETGSDNSSKKTDVEDTQKALGKQAANEAAGVANQKALGKQAANEAAAIAKENSLRPSSLKAELNSATEALNQGKTSDGYKKLDDFYNKSNEVIKNYYNGSNQQKASLKNLGYNDSNIEYLSRYNKLALNSLKDTKSEEEAQKQNEENENDGNGDYTVDTIE